MCPDCGKRFAMQNYFDRHCSIEHNTGSVFTCVDCEATFEEKEELIEHMAEHPLMKPYVCKMCNKEFTRKYHLERHVAHTECDGSPRNKFKCQVKY